MDAFELDEESRALALDMEQLDAEHAKIMASVQKRLDANRAARDVAQALLTEKRSKLFSKLTYENLCDPLAYQVISEMSWNSVDHETAAKHIKQVLFPETYVQDRLEFYGYSKPFMCFGISVPKQADPVKLARTAELLAPVLKTATENSELARISIMEDDCSYYADWHIVWDEEEQLFTLRGVYSHESADLLEILKRVPTYS